MCVCEYDCLYACAYVHVFGSERLICAMVSYRSHTHCENYVNRLMHSFSFRKVSVCIYFCECLRVCMCMCMCM